MSLQDKHNTFFSTFFRSILPFFLLLFTFSSLFAQTADDSVALKAVVIQATRTGAKSPVPHSNVGAAQIARTYQAQDVPFLLSGVPSLVETSDAGAGVGYTGLRIRGSDPTRVNVTINGVPLNDAESQGVYWVNLPDLAASAAEIQVQRGVGSSTNGAGAFGATVNVDLSRFSAVPTATLSNSVGSFGLLKNALQVGTGYLPGTKVSFSARVSSIRSDGYIDRAAANLQSVHLNGGYIDDRQSLQAHLLWGKEKTYQAWYGLPAQYYDSGENRTYNPAGTERSDQPHPNEVDNYTQRHHLLHYKRHLSPHLMLQLNGHYTRGYGYYEQYKAGESLTDYQMPELVLTDTVLGTSDLIRRRWLDNHFYGATWALVQKTRFSNITYGGALSRYTGKHFGEVVWAQLATAPINHHYYDNDAQKTDGNVFVKAEISLNKRMTALVDMQVRQVRYSFLGYNNLLENVTQDAQLLFFNPKAGLHYQWNPHTTYTLFAGIGNREPNRDDYTQSTPNSRPKAERLYNIESGFKTGGKKWNTSINLFGMYYRNQLVLDGRINDVGAYIRTNVPESYRAGVEVEAMARPSERFTCAGNLALSRNRITHLTEFRDNWADGIQEQFLYKNTDLAFSPNLIARGELTYAILPDTRTHALSATLIGKWVGSQYLDNTGNKSTQLPAFGFLDTRINYDLKEIIGQQVSIIIAVNNLLNAQYASNGWVYRFTSPGYDPTPDDAYTRKENGDTYHQAGYFPQAGRNFMATLVVTF